MMNKQFEHAMLPQTIHDELARQNFIQTIELYLFRTISSKVKQVYEEQVKPQFEREHQHPPKNRHEIRALMWHEPYYQWMSALKRTLQEMMWDSVCTSVERQLPELVERAKDKAQPLGSLTLDPELPIPIHQKAMDIHCMPGGYHSEFTEDDVAMGAIYDRGVYIYFLGCLGPLNDDLGH